MYLWNDNICQRHYTVEQLFGSFQVQLTVDQEKGKQYKNAWSTYMKGSIFIHGG